jgi:hypothetical protein
MTFLKIRIFGDGQHVGFVFLVITDTGAWAAGCHNHCCAGVWVGPSGSYLSLPQDIASSLRAYRRVAEYQAHANDCRKMAARMARPEDKELLEQLAQAWEKVAKLRKCDLTDGDEQA